MNQTAAPSVRPLPTRWSVGFAFVLLYLCWGTTYLVNRQGVHSAKLPPALFSGVRVFLAGVLLLAYLAVRRTALKLTWRDMLWVVLGGWFFFVFGNGLLTVALTRDDMPSSTAAVLSATTPLWIALIETVSPRTQKLRWQGWLGLIAGLGGVILIAGECAVDPAEFFCNSGSILVLGSACAGGLAALLLRNREHHASHLAAAAYQMILGGGALALIGLVVGEGKDLRPDLYTPEACFAFSYLLIVGSLVGYVAYNWLLGHVPVVMVGTYAYVNPVVAILVGWLFAGEAVTVSLVGGMVVILIGVALVRSGAKQVKQIEEPLPDFSG